MGNVNIINHPLVKHKITLMRDEKTGTREFRILVEEVAMLMGYEAMRDLPTEDVEVKTPITTRKLPMLCRQKACYRAYPESRPWHGKRDFLHSFRLQRSVISVFIVTRSHTSLTSITASSLIE